MGSGAEAEPLLGWPVMVFPEEGVTRDACPFFEVVRLLGLLEVDPSSAKEKRRIRSSAGISPRWTALNWAL
jgi:hypothetical protein